MSDGYDLDGHELTPFETQLLKMFLVPEGHPILTEYDGPYVPDEQIAKELEQDDNVRRLINSLDA
jgi:hypothetical protein